MISESHLWKVDLHKRSEWLKTKKSQRRWPEAACVRVEQCVMVGCYCIRKLIEARKLTDAVANRLVLVVVYEPLGKPVHCMNWHHLEKLYDLENGLKNTKPLTFICIQIIHSFVYINGFSEEGGLEFVLFSSDFNRNENLIEVSIDDLSQAFAVVANDDVVEAHYVWKEKKKDYNHTQI